MIHYILIDVLA